MCVCSVYVCERLAADQSHPCHFYLSCVRRKRLFYGPAMVGRRCFLRASKWRWGGKKGFSCLCAARAKRDTLGFRICNALHNHKIWCCHQSHGDFRNLIEKRKKKQKKMGLKYFFCVPLYKFHRVWFPWTTFFIRNWQQSALFVLIRSGKRVIRNQGVPALRQMTKTNSESELVASRQQISKIF